MVGVDAFDANGKGNSHAARSARQSAGITEYEKGDLRLVRKLALLAVNKTGRLTIPQWNPDALPCIAEILQGLGNDILAIHNEIHDPEVRCLKVRSRVREAEYRLRVLTK